MNGTHPVLTRRAFVLGAAGASIALAVTACSSHHAPKPLAPGGDLQTVALATALESQVVSIYQAFADALTSGRLGPAAPALSAFARSAIEHHTQHAATWDAILRDGKHSGAPAAPRSGQAELSAVRAARRIEDVVPVLQALERRIAQAHAAAAGTLKGSPAVLAAATIAPVEAMHAAALGYLSSGSSTVVSFLTPVPGV